MSANSAKTVVNSWNEWDPLKHVIVGKADYTCIPWPEPAINIRFSLAKDCGMIGNYGPRPQASVEKANEQLDNLAEILEKRGIQVDRPTPIQWNQSMQTPDWRVNAGIGCMPPRDVLLIFGKEILEATMSYRCRWFKYACWREGGSRCLPIGSVGGLSGHKALDFGPSEFN